jgi:radical SAM superfamily enzyme YgiQ (UPF0313 family)
MRVLLVNPPAQHIIRESLPPVVEDSTGIYPPLGLLYVAAYAETVPGCEVRVLDCQAEQVDHARLPGYLATWQPDVVGIQAMTFTLIDATLVARAVRQARPDATIVMGGPHPTLFPFETLEIPAVDAVVVGEGEFTFARLLEHILKTGTAGPVDGVLTRQTPDRESPPLNYIQDLDALRWPARNLIDLTRYSSPMARHGRVTTMMSSRGCPFDCVFCDRPQMGKRFRKRSALSVFEEMAHCVRNLGIEEIIFYDDTFTVDRQRVLDLCDRIIAERLPVTWDIRARVDTMTPDMIIRLRQAGCRRIHYGVETGCQRIQATIGKRLDLSRVREVFGATRAAGIETLGYFMIGLPTETRADLDETLRLLVELPMDYAHIGILTPYPGTAIYRDALKRGIYPDDYWRTFARNPTPDFHPRYWNEVFTDDELNRILKDAYHRFYSRPGYLLKRVLTVRSPGELFRKGVLGLKLLFSVRP